MKALTKILVLLLIFYLEPFAQSEDAGTTSATFLKLSTNARTAALGHSAVALAGDAGSMYYNPASISKLNASDFILSYSSLYQEMKSGYLGVSLPFNENVFGFGLVYFNSGEMTRTEAAPGGFIKTGSFSNSDIGILLSYSRRITSNLHIGATAKGIFESLANKSASAFAFDMGGLYSIQNLDLGIAVKNIGTGLEFDSVSFSLPMIISAGAAYHLLDNNLLFTVAGEMVGESNTQFSFGSEFKPIEYFALRVGYRTGLSDLEGLTGLTGGIGLFYNEFKLNYAYNAYGDFGAVHLISIGFKALF